MTTAKFDLKAHHKAHLDALWRKAPFVLRLTEWKDYPVPVLVIKERLLSAEAEVREPPPSTFERKAGGALVERGHIAGEAQRRCLPILRGMVERVQDDAGIPLDLHRFLTHEGLRLRLNLPLDEEAGAKLALLCRLQERVTDLERVELIAHRVAGFTREEAAYWLSRTTSADADANRWALAGMRIMLGGQPNDKSVREKLERLR